YSEGCPLLALSDIGTPLGDKDEFTPHGRSQVSCIRKFCFDHRTWKNRFSPAHPLFFLASEKHKTAADQRNSPGQYQNTHETSQPCSLLTEYVSADTKCQSPADSTESIHD